MNVKNKTSLVLEETKKDIYNEKKTIKSGASLLYSTLLTYPAM